MEHVACNPVGLHSLRSGKIHASSMKMSMVLQADLMQHEGLPRQSEAHTGYAARHNRLGIICTYVVDRPIV